jgi:hypothetical protein
MMRPLAAAILAIGATLGCTSASGTDRNRERADRSAPPQASATLACRENGAARSLPAEVRETSGLARGRRDSKVLWTHNDSGNQPVLFALSEEGRILGKARVLGATLLDWEDIEAGPCGDGTCLFIADIGDNAR